MSRIVLAALAALALAASAPGQIRTQDEGTTGFCVFTESAGNIDVLTALAPLAAGATPVYQVATQNPIARTLNRRTFQAATETELLLARQFNLFPPDGLLLFMPTHDAGSQQAFVEALDFRQFLPTSTQVFLLPAGFDRIRYDLLKGQDATFAANGTIYACAQGPSGVSVTQLIYGPGQPVAVHSSLTIAGRECSRWVSRMIAHNGKIVVPLLDGIAILTPGSGAAPIALDGIIDTPAFAGGGRYEVGTNVCAPWGTSVTTQGPNTMDAVVGLRAPGGTPGHSWMAFRVDLQSANGGFDPFGAGLLLTAGFHEIACTLDQDRAVATFLLGPAASLAAGFGPGSVALLRNDGTAGFTTSVTPLPSLPVGNPEASRATASPAGPVFFLSATATGDLMNAIGTGTNNAFGALAAIPMAGAFNPRATDRPLSLPGGPNVGVSSPGTGLELFSVINGGAGLPPLLLPFGAPVATNGSPSTLPNVIKGSLFGPLPVFFQGHADFGLTPFPFFDDVVAAGLPIVGVPAAFWSDNISGAPAIPDPGVLLLQPAADASTIPTFGPRIPVLNFSGGVPFFGFPGGAPPAIKFTTLVPPPGNPAPIVYTPALLGPITSEILSV